MKLFSPRILAVAMLLLVLGLPACPPPFVDVGGDWSVREDGAFESALWNFADLPNATVWLGAAGAQVPATYDFNQNTHQLTVDGDADIGNNQHAEFSADLQVNRKGDTFTGALTVVYKNASGAVLSTTTVGLTGNKVL